MILVAGKSVKSFDLIWHSLMITSSKWRYKFICSNTYDSLEPIKSLEPILSIEPILESLPPPPVTLFKSVPVKG